MPIYEWDCKICGAYIAPIVPLDERNLPRACPQCGYRMERRISAPYGKVIGRADGKIISGGGPDRFTADVLGTKLKDLPAALRSDPKVKA